MITDRRHKDRRVEWLHSDDIAADTARARKVHLRNQDHDDEMSDTVAFLVACLGVAAVTMAWFWMIV